ncbi:SPOR domain-containing protein [uncultured Proteiniphilum sp.]|uniref:SPOR domain-containing protein n=1 Tax=uncultured Proteiniphilum sp. TaxID=497637 RepID=UPI002616AC9F|nr:SPOR domain-containing protein [uncultured Proteiniphilum sp.]
MRFLLHYPILLLLLLVSAGAYAQSSQKKEILRELNSVVPGKGRVSVYEDESIGHVLGRPMAPPRTVYTNAEGSTQWYRVRGYKIQAFSGNNQRTSKNEAHQKQQLINDSYPEHETVVLFESPFWRLRVGNFQTRSEAEEVLKEMVRSFPSFGKEMYIVVDEVKIPVNQPYSDEH